jgi:hypothetical protein
VFEIPATDRRPLDDFPLLGRWTRREHHRLSAEVLGTITPLSVSRALELAPEAAKRCVARRAAEWDLSISAEWDDPEPVRERLRQQGVDPNAIVVASWDQNTAIALPWSVFVDFWDAFCYPSSDDVTVWDPGASWVLCYRHYQLIEFGFMPPAA